MSLFSRQGFDSTSVQQICQEAGVSKGAFYHYFETKQSLFVALMDDWLKQFTKVLNDNASPDDDVPTTLLNQVSNAGMVFSLASTGFPILIDFWRNAMKDEALLSRSSVPYQYFLQHFEMLIKKGISEGSFKTEIDTQKTAQLFVALTMGYLLQAAITPEQSEWIPTVGYGFQALLDGMRKEK